MRAVTVLAVWSALLAACTGGGPESRTATPAPAPIDTSVTATQAPVAAVTPVPTTAEDAVIEQTVRDCVTPSLPDDAATAASHFDACLNRGEGGFTVSGVSGTIPIVLVERSVNPTVCRSDDFIAWYVGGEWRVQHATPLLPDPSDDRLLGLYTMPPVPQLISPQAVARQAAAGDTALLTVLTETDSCGSKPGIVPMLFALHDDTWRIAWDPRGTPIASLGNPRSGFADASGIEHVHVRGSLWGTADPASAIFSESFPGPQRYVDDTWTYSGLGYALSDRQVEASAFSALVTFIFRLSTGDDAGATKFLVDPTLLATAKDLGLVQKPLGQKWAAADAQRCCTIHILSRAWWKEGGPPQPVVVTFVQRGTEWLISGIAVE